MNMPVKQIPPTDTTSPTPTSGKIPVFTGSTTIGNSNISYSGSMMTLEKNKRALPLNYISYYKGDQPK